LKRVTVVKADKVEIKPFFLQEFLVKDFSSNQEMPNSMKKISKKELKELAESLGLDYTDEHIGFTKKLMTAYYKRYREKR